MIADTILLRCPECKREEIVERDSADPRNAAIMEMECLVCDHREWGTVFYFDRTGKEILPNESTWDE